MMRNPFPFLIALLLLIGCAPDDVRFEENPIPPYNGVPTVVVDAYLTRVYIDLIGREPLPGEMEQDRATLRAGDLGLNARLDLIDRLMGGDDTYREAHDRKMFDDLSGVPRRHRTGDAIAEMEIPALPRPAGFPGRWHRLSLLNLPVARARHPLGGSTPGGHHRLAGGQPAVL